MPLASLHPLPLNPTTGQTPLSSLSARIGGAVGSIASAAGGGGVSRETLKGLQDVVWSDDEDDPDCILCAEPLDLSDLNFKPCQCGMQICQFCYNKLLSTDPRCPGCRRAYDAKAVVFQPVDWEEVKRAKEKKTRRAKTIKQLDSLGRRHLLGIRIVMKNTVYVVGMKLPGPGDEAIPILRSNDYFGQYGKISKLFLRDRTTLTSTAVHTLTPDNPSTSTAIYIVYARREDAARAISALDGVPAPQGPVGTVLKATYGTMRYCDSFLRGIKCDTAACQNLHEWGGESDCFTKDDMETALLRPAEYDARQKQAQLQAQIVVPKSTWSKPAADEVVGSTGLPSSANWGKPVGSGRAQTARTGSTAPGATARTAVAKPTIPATLTKNSAAFPLPTPSPLPVAAIKDRRKNTSAAMGRGRSSDSTQSTTGSSAQTSPKRKGSTLPAVVAKNALSELSTNGPPPEFVPVSGESSRSHLPPSDPESEGLTDSVSAESEAGPSTASPPPQTPGRTGDAAPPPPLTSDPIFVHSPYEEPRLSYFPLHDPGFEFNLGLDEAELRRFVNEADGYRPSPFSKTLLGLAELGVLAPQEPAIDSLPPDSQRFIGSFQPFDASLDAGPFLGLGHVGTGGPNQEGTSSRLPEATPEARRTTSRFDFARPPSAGRSARGQSPFTMRRPIEDLSMTRTGNGNGWISQQGLYDGGSRRASGVSGSGAFGAQMTPFGGNFEGTAMSADMAWPAEGSGAAAAYHPQGSPSFPRHGAREEGSRPRDREGERDRERARERDRSFPQFGRHGKGPRAEQEEYEAAAMQYGLSNQPSSRNRNLFSPEHDAPSRHLSPSHSLHPQALTPGRGWPDARTLQQYHQQQMRSGSPTPEGYGRRY